MRRRFLDRSLRASCLLTGVFAVAVATRCHDARAGWPPSPSADFTSEANWPSDPGYRTGWQYWSFLPKQNGGTAPYLAADQKLGASGMSIDKAWSVTTGRPEVLIGQIDCGIVWDNDEVVDKAWLNPKELGGVRKPQNAQGAACAGAGDLVGYDCNGDGVLSVADYRDDPRIAPAVAGEKCFTDGDRTKTGPDRILGDRNRNCILDAGDLIEIFSDGVDDDANGYTDDISGWDFFKNDNNPYDDTRNDHGTRQAKLSTATGNDGKGGIGTCPLCRFFPLRVGDSYVADANAYGKAVIYAADNGAKVVQEALVTVNQTPLSVAAMDYAYAHGVTIVASIGNDDSRHHVYPALANHVVTVHSVRFNGPDARGSSSFLAYDTCSGYGAQLSLSISGESCSSDAAGHAAGIAGLIYATAMSVPQPLQLTAEEVIQLMKMTADDVDVAESRDPKLEVSSDFYESKPGWDQRFGYGRANALSAVMAVKNRLIPPEVDIVSPLWFEPIYADRGLLQVPIIGRIAAARAPSYDYRVDWAPGATPDEASFKPLIAEVKNVPGATVTGGINLPLASIDPRQIDTAPIDTSHQNDRTVTLRVHAVAHYAEGDVHGEARRAIGITNQRNGLDADLLPGFPIKVGGSGEPSPKLADIDGDGVRDIVYATSEGSVHVWSLKSGLPVEVPGFPFRTAIEDGLNANPTSEPTVPSYVSAPAYATARNGGVAPEIAHEAVVSAPAVADLDGDGKNEIALTTYAGTIYVVDKAGHPLAGWPKRLPLVPSCPLDTSKAKPATCAETTSKLARGAFASPVLIDMDRDGKLEIVQAAFDGNIYVFHADGTPLDGWPVAVHAPGSARLNRIMSTPALADYNGDGIPDLLTGSNETIGGDLAGPVFAIDGRGNKAPKGPYLPNWPIVLASSLLSPTLAEGITASPASGDFDGDGVPEVLAQGNGAPPYLLRADPGPQQGNGDPPKNRLPIVLDPVFGAQSKAASPDTMAPYLSQPSIGDLDQDGTPDVVTSGGSVGLSSTVAGGATIRPFQNLLAMWSGKTGHMLPGSPVVLEDSALFDNHAIADITGDDYPEVIVGTSGNFVRAVDACGREAPGWPKFTNGWILATPAVGDIDGDTRHSLEVVAGTREGYIFAWHTKGREDGVIQWESVHHDNANTGDYGTKLAQGTLKRAGAPIDCSVPAPPVQGSYEAGGCALGMSSGSRGKLVFAAFAALLAAAYLRRRRT